MQMASYSDRMRARFHATGKGFPVDLGTCGTFWSRGFRGCPDCEKDTHENVPLYFFREGDRSGWRCKG